MGLGMFSAADLRFRFRHCGTEDGTVKFHGHAHIMADSTPIAIILSTSSGVRISPEVQSTARADNTAAPGGTGARGAELRASSAAISVHRRIPCHDYLIINTCNQ